MATKIIQCSCKHDFQDAQYGQGRRVANSTASKPVTYRCTVCAKVQ